MNVIKSAVICLLLTVLSFAQSADDQLNILSVSPQGSTTSPDQTGSIVVLFNKPMTELRAVPEDESDGPLRFDPPIDGKFRWLGTSTLVFTPSDVLPFATAYTARVPAGTKALDGSFLREDYSWSFETLFPDLAASIPTMLEQNVKTDKPIFLLFNQPVDSSKAENYISLRESDPASRKNIPFRIRHPSDDELTDLHWYSYRQTVPQSEDETVDRRNVIVVTPSELLAKGTRHVITIERGLTGLAGPLGSAEKREILFTTHPEFSFLHMYSRELQAPDGEILLEFTTPVQINTLLEHLTFDPAMNIPEYYSRWTYSTSNIYLNLDLLPDTTYRLRIDKKLQDIFGQELGDPIDIAFSTGSYRPHLSMVTGQGVIEAYMTAEYTVSMRNIDTLRLRMAALPQDKIIPVAGRRDLYYNTDQDIPLEDLSDTLIAVSHTPNVWKHYTIDLQKALGNNSSGTIFLETSHIDHRVQYPRRFRSILQVTELGLTAKFSPDNTFIWVTHLRTTDPVAGASVEIRGDDNTILWRGTTNADGMALGPGWGPLGVKPENRWSSPRLWIFVRNEADFAYTHTEDGTGIEPWRFGIQYDWRPQFRPLQATIFTERGMYRAGEEVNIKGIVRARVDDAWEIPLPEDSLYITIRNPRNDIIYSDSLIAGEFGSFDRTLRLGNTAPSGTYSIELSAPQILYDDDEYYDISYDAFAFAQFRVEAFRPAEFTVNVHPVTREIIPGDTMHAAVSARYLFGAPMKNDRAEWQIAATPGSFTPPGYTGYVFGASWELWDDFDSVRRRQIIANEQSALDENGTLSLSQVLPVGRLTGPHNLIIESTVQSASRRTITGSANIIAHGGSYYAGIKRSSSFISTGDTFRYEIITVKPDGTVSPGRELTLQIIKREWSSVRQAGVGGRYRWITERIDSVRETRKIITGDKPVTGEFVPSEPGFYFIAVDGQDERGNTVRSSAYFYVSGAGYVAWQRRDDDRIDLIADAERYRPGDTARLIIQSPYESARALITIERDGIMEQWTQTVHGSAPEIEFQVTENHLPNVFVSALLLHGRVPFEQHPSELDDVGKPSFKIGYINLPVDAGTRHLTIDVSTDKQHYRPGDSVSVHISVRDAAKSPVQTEIALSVADAGVLNLINYRLPDPFDSFYGPRPLSVSTSQILAHLVDQRSYGEKGEDSGGGGGLETMAGMDIRGDFRFTAYWNPSIITGPDGKAVIRFKLPDNLTEFKAMASGQTKDALFGYGETSFTVNKELLLQPTLPRFARIGDAFEGGVLITNYTDDDGRVTVTSGVTGAIQSTGSGSSTLQLKAGESKEVRFSYNANTAGNGQFTFTAGMNGFSDAVTVEIPVQRPVIRESVALYESTTDARREAVAIPEKIYHDLGGLELTAASTALVGLEHSIEYLITYPYGCLEQQLSRILPIILAEDMVRAFDLHPIRGRDLRETVQNVLNQLNQFQTDFGGFALWRGNRQNAPYVSAYALYTIAEAERHGYIVEQSVRDGGIQYIQNYLRDFLPNETSPYTKHTTLATQALSIYALSLLGISEDAYIEQLYRQLKDLPLFAKSFLLKTIINTSNDAQMKETILREFMNAMKVDAISAHFEERTFDGLEWTYSSNIRTTAIILDAFLHADIGEDISHRIVRWLLDQQRNGRWASTQDNVYSVTALAAYYDRYERTEPDFTARISVDGKTALEEIYTSHTLATGREMITFDSLRPGETMPVDVTVDGRGRLYYGIRMNYYPTDSATRRDEGLTILKSITPAGNNEQNDAGHFTAGELYKVTITVIAPHQRNFVVVDDPLPGGFEPVNLSFATESQTLGDYLRDDPQRWWGSFNHVEQYDDRVLLFADRMYAGVHTHSYLVRAMSYGTFDMPPTHSEQMYEPDVFGRTAGRTITVE